MTHRNTPLTVERGQRVVNRVVRHNRPIAHDVAEFHIVRSILSKWVDGYRQSGPIDGLEASSSAGYRVPRRLPTHGRVD